WRARLFRVLLDIVDGISHTGYLFGVLVRNLNVELFLESHHQLNGVQRVGPQVIDEPRVSGDFRLVNTEFIHNYRLYPFLNGTFCHVVAPLKSIWLSTNRVNYS